MVYETDFYTTRRPYSRPTISSYSVTTPIRVIPGIGRVHTYTYSPYSSLYYHTIPHYTTSYALPGSLFLPSAVPLRYYTRSTPVRVVTSPVRDYSPPRIFSVHVRPSVIHRELLRIEHKPRVRYGFDAKEEFLNSSTVHDFEDDIRSIRTQTSKVLQRIHAPLPRARRAVSCAPFSRYGYDSTEREFLDNIRGKSVLRDDILTLSRYADTPKYTGTFAPLDYQPGYYLNRLRRILFDWKAEGMSRFYRSPIFARDRPYLKNLGFKWELNPVHLL